MQGRKYHVVFMRCFDNIHVAQYNGFSFSSDLVVQPKILQSGNETNIDIRSSAYHIVSCNFMSRYGTTCMSLYRTLLIPTPLPSL